MTDHFRVQGAFSWFELTTTDVHAAEAFYSRLFGWNTEPWVGEGAYTLIKVDGKDVGGMVASSDPQDPRQGWGIYVTVTDVDETAARVPDYGGTVLVEPTNIPKIGRYCVIRDPLGHTITAITYSRS